MTNITNSTTVKPDMVHDLYYHVEKGNCYLVSLICDFSCPEVGDGGINVDTYIIADTNHHAKYIASRLYPEATVIEVKRVNAKQYVASRT